MLPWELDETVFRRDHSNEVANDCSQWKRSTAGSHSVADEGVIQHDDFSLVEALTVPSQTRAIFVRFLLPSLNDHFCGRLRLIPRSLK